MAVKNLFAALFKSTSLLAVVAIWMAVGVATQITFGADSFMTNIASLVVMLMVAVPLSAAAAARYRGESPLSYSEALKARGDRILPLIGWSLLIGLGVGLVLLVALLIVFGVVGAIGGDAGVIIMVLSLVLIIGAAGGVLMALAPSTLNAPGLRMNVRTWGAGVVMAVVVVAGPLIPALIVVLATFSDAMPDSVAVPILVVVVVLEVVVAPLSVALLATMAPNAGLREVDGAQ